MKRALPALLALLLPLAAAAQPRDWVIDPVHTRVIFRIQHLGLSDAIGTVAQPEGRLRFDPDDWASATLDVSLALDTLDLGETEWNRRMLRRDFLHADKHPRARFVSRRIEPLDAERFRVEGELELRGETHPATLEVRYNGARRHPLTLRRTAGFSATLTLSRAVLGLRAWPNLIGDAVRVEIEVEAKRARRKADDALEE